MTTGNKKHQKKHRILYLDEKGDHGKPPPNGKSSRDFILTGVGILTENMIDANTSIEKLLHEYFPNKDLKKIKEYELHYDDIVDNKNMYAEFAIKQKKRSEFVKKIGEIIVKAKPVIFETKIDKTAYQGDASFRKKMIEMVIIQTSRRFANYLIKYKETGQIIIDEHSSYNDTFFSYIRKIMAGWHESDGNHYIPKHETNYKQIIDTLIVQKSHLSCGLQLADICGGIANSEHKRHDPFVNLISMVKKFYNVPYEPFCIPLDITEWKKNNTTKTSREHAVAIVIKNDYEKIEKGVYKVKSQSEPSKYHKVNLIKKTCECKAFEYVKSRFCAHYFACKFLIDKKNGSVKL